MFAEIFEPTRLYSQKEIAPILGKSVAWLERGRWAGTGPKYRKIGRTVRYLGSDLNEWVASQARTSTSDKGAA